MSAQRLHISAILIIASAIFWSCSSKKDHVYLQDMVENQLYAGPSRPTAIVQPDDRLQINITCKLPELAKPFNQDPELGQTGYPVNAYGDIQLPILGDIHVGGLTLEQVQDEIKKRLVEGNYIKDPLVTAKFLNFRYTVLGAVGSNGVYTIDGDRITLLEAIAKAGDLTAAAKPDRVTVIREEQGGRKMYVCDIRSAELFNSPCFYLQQNDLVYVEPKYKSKEREARAWQIASMVLGAAAVVASIVYAVRK